MEKYICIHGHFYQPPRENPWLEDIELQDQAYPYHDWNERITEECYRQNAASRILSKDRKIVDIVNNYASISFNFGPTLLSWLKSHAPDVYARILAADKQSMERFSGHGAALAQAYNHMILPLCNERDKHTQVIWGIRDFEIHFKRQPEGMWLPETAVNTDTLEVLVDHGIRFTILSPRQAKSVRKIGRKNWKDVSEQTLDTTVPYLCNLPSGRQIVLFFYNGAIASDVAYGGLLHNGESFAQHLYDAFPKDGAEARLVHIATDGESFGHHHRHGDMALAYCMHHIETKRDAKLTIYAEYLERFPPENEVLVCENSSWSCVHGVERWKSNCGCAVEPDRSGQQAWRGPLREALDWLRDRVADIFVERMQPFTDDPWKLRNAYIDIIHDRTAEHVQNRLAEWTGKNLNPEQVSTLIKLLEMQRNAMLMYTSCGWFFDDIFRIETIQILQYASRAIQICRDLHGTDLDPEFRDRLEKAPSSQGKLPTGRAVYEAFVTPTMIDLKRVGAHLALSSIFQGGQPDSAEVYSYSARIRHFNRLEAGIETLTICSATVRANLTWEEQDLFLVALYLGGQNLFAAVDSLAAHNTGKCEGRLTEAFRAGDTSEVMRLMNVLFKGQNYSIPHLFRDEQRHILGKLLKTTWQEIELSFRHIYEHNYPMMQLMHKMNIPLPKAFANAAEHIINRDICRLIQNDPVDTHRINALIDDVRRFSLAIDQKRIQFEFNRKATCLFTELEKSPQDTDLLGRIETLLDTLKLLDTDFNLQHPQNVFFTIAKNVYPSVQKKADAGEQNARQWVIQFKKLAHHLDLAIA